jgi:cytochrome c553
MVFVPGRPLPLLAALIAASLASTAARAADRAEAAKLEHFEKKVRPILVNHCYGCHSADTKPSGGLRVDDRNGLLTGGNSGPAVVPGAPGKSLVLRRVTQKDEKRRMPREGKALSQEQVEALRTWIRDGAAWPAAKLPASFGKPKPRYTKLRKEHWAWQPLTSPAVPAVRDSAWPRADLDRFLLAKLEAKGLRPVGDADRATLLRRVTFDLTGLPPTPAEIDAFLKDGSANAYERVVDRLLGSPAFGERWGRHWLDVARYGESTGPSRNVPYPHAWRYRDYVIDSVNADVPFDQFIREQIAGDLLPAGSARERDRLLTATGFLALGVKDVNQRFKVRFVMDNVDEQIDAVTRSVLALTVSCARCHDHKFDPIPTTDYYALAGIFTSTDNCAGVRNKMGGGGLDYYVPEMLVALKSDLPPVPPAEVEKAKRELAEAKKAWDSIRGTPEGLAKAPNGFPRQRPFRLKYERLRARMASLTDPAARGHAVHGARDAKKVGDTEVRVRGIAEDLGPKVPRGFLTAFEVPGAAKVSPKQSGRLELARWLTSPHNPLTPRVIVNRTWRHLFGEGIVTTVDNFGVTGDRPSHPELLDHLASNFVREGWSVKKLVRMIVLSRAYQLSSDSSATSRLADPANRLVWRHAPRRLSAEEMRDALLAAAGTLDRDRPVGSPTKKLEMIEMPDDGPKARSIREQADKSAYRSVYLPLVRGLIPQALAAFDPVEQGLVTGRRDTTTVPGQALFLLNSPFVRHQSLALAERLLAAKGDDTALVCKAYRLTLGRAPEPREVERAAAFVVGYESAFRELPPEERAVGPADGRKAAWLALVQALFSSAEFRYLR